MIMDDELVKNARFLQELEQNIRLSNNKVIHKEV